MAVVFISPKQRQRALFTAITVIFALFLVIISLIVFLYQPKEVSQSLVLNKPKVSIDMNIFSSDQFIKLQSFGDVVAKMGMHQYSYNAVVVSTTETKKGSVQTTSPVSGFIFADSIDQARANLENMGLIVSNVQEVEIGRDNPFTPYYQQATATTPSNTK